jgi:ribosomal protein S18 acetylase RimI-like enzyme
MVPILSLYHPTDHPALLTFLRAAFTHLGFAFDPTSKDRDLLDIPAHYTLFLLARHVDDVIGTIALRPLAPTVGELKRFYVHPAHQRQGLGTALLTTALTHARSQPWHALRLDTSRKSPAALALFRKHGFVEIPRYNDDPFAEIFLELTLPHRGEAG